MQTFNLPATLAISIAASMSLSACGQAAKPQNLDPNEAFVQALIDGTTGNAIQGCVVDFLNKVIPINTNKLNGSPSQITDTVKCGSSTSDGATTNIKFKEYRTFPDPIANSVGKFLRTANSDIAYTTCFNYTFKITQNGNTVFNYDTSRDIPPPLFACGGPNTDNSGKISIKFFTLMPASALMPNTPDHPYDPDAPFLVITYLPPNIAVIDAACRNIKTITPGQCLGPEPRQEAKDKCFDFSVPKDALPPETLNLIQQLKGSLQETYPRNRLLSDKELLEKLQQYQNSLTPLWNHITPLCPTGPK